MGIVIPAAACYAIAGTLHAAIGGALWGGFFRMMATTQATYVVNSICHVWGKRPFESNDRSCNNAVVAVLSLGRISATIITPFRPPARHGLLRWQFDTSYTLILLLRRLGLAWNVKTPSAAQIDAKMQRPNERDAVMFVAFDSAQSFSDGPTAPAKQAAA